VIDNYNDRVETVEEMIGSFNRRHKLKMNQPIGEIEWVARMMDLLGGRKCIYESFLRS
jgi:hypothetical protein